MLAGACFAHSFGVTSTNLWITGTFGFAFAYRASLAISKRFHGNLISISLHLKFGCARTKFLDQVIGDILSGLTHDSVDKCRVPHCVQLVGAFETENVHTVPTGVGIRSRVQRLMNVTHEVNEK